MAAVVIGAATSVAVAAGDGPAEPTCPIGWVPWVWGGPPTANVAVVPVTGDDANDLVISGPSHHYGTAGRNVLVGISGAAIHRGGTWTPLPFSSVAVIQAATRFDEGDGAGPKLFVAGIFSEVDGEPIATIAREADGIWAPLGEGVNATVLALAVADFGEVDSPSPRLVAGGNFTMAGGQTASRIAAWDGVDWSPIGAGFDAGVSALAYGRVGADPDAEPALFAGGSFAFSGDAEVARVARWNGTAWEAVGGGVTGGSVSSLLIADLGDGPRLFAAGSFDGAGDSAAQWIASWDGESWSALGDGVPTSVVGIAALEGTLYAGLFDGSVRRWDGATWQTTGQSNAGIVRVVVGDRGNGPEILITGSFTEVDGIPAARLAWFGADGWSADGPHGALVGAAPGSFFQSARRATWRDRDVAVIGGRSPDEDTAPTPVGFFDGNTVEWIEAPFAGRVLDSVVVDLGGTELLVLAGQFRSPGESLPFAVVAYDGTSWSTVESRMTATLSPGHAVAAWTIDVHEDEDGPSLCIGGYFKSIEGVEVNGVARLPLAGVGLEGLESESWQPLGDGPGTMKGVDVLRSFDLGDGTALYAGCFYLAEQFPEPMIRVWRNGAWHPVGALGSPAAKTRTFSLVVHDAGDGPQLHASGYSAAEGAVRLIRWDGKEWHEIVQAIPAGLYTTLAVHDDGTGPALHLGTEATYDAPPIARQVFRLVDGQWQPLGHGVGSFNASSSAPFRMVWGLASLGARGLVVVGNFANALETPYVGVAARGVALWGNPNAPYVTSAPSSPTTFVGATVTLSATVAGTQDGGAVHHQWLRDGIVLRDGDRISGATSTALTITDVSFGDAGVYTLLSVNDCGSTESAPATLTVLCPGDVNGDGVVDGADLGILLNAWGTDGAGTLADINGDGIVDGKDLGMLLANWGPAGC